ncbi:hypothetical protein BH23ACT12_BH23ACT12_15760 [soil metagenome]
MRTRLVAALAALLLLTAGCAPEDETTAGWRTSDLRAASSPVALDDTLAVVNGDSSNLEMVVMDGQTGDVRFTRPWSAAPSYPRFSVGRPALLDGVVVGIEPNGLQTLLIARNSTTGELMWKSEVSETFGPFACGELVCSEDDWSLPSAALVGRDPATGETRWTSPGSQTYLFNGPDLLVEALLNEPVIRSVDPGTGDERWRNDLAATMGAGARPVISEAQLIDGTLLVESNAGTDAGNTTLGLDPASGSIKWRRDGFGVCPRTVADVAIVCSSGSGLQRLNPSTGEPVWTVAQFAYPAEAGPLLGITANGEQVLVNEAPNKLVAVDLDDGSVTDVPAGLSWMRFISGESGKKNPDAPAGEYIGPLDPVPFDAKTMEPARVEEPGDVPDFVGFTFGETRVFMNANGGLQGVAADRRS